MRFRELGLDLVVARFPVGVDIGCAREGRFFSVTAVPGEVSLVCEPSDVPEGAQKIERGWRCLVVEGPIPFEMTGVLASMAGPLAEAEVPIFALSTFDTDYILIKADDVKRAVASLIAAGHEVAAR